jgi:hypothetical protein
MYIGDSFQALWQLYWSWITRGWSGGQVVIVGGASNATVVTPNIQVCGSVVHIIDTVLLPGALSTIPSQPWNSTTGKMISFFFFIAT